MGLFRKMTSATTLGLVDFRSDKERIARYTKQTRDIERDRERAAAKAAGKAAKPTFLDRYAEVAAREAAKRAEKAATVTPAPATTPIGPPPGWYDDPNDPSRLRWWDGVQWTDAARAPEGHSSS